MENSGAIVRHLGLPDVPLIRRRVIEADQFFRENLKVNPMQWIGYLRGIDFHQPVERVRLPAGAKIIRHNELREGDTARQTESFGSKPFVYFALPGASPTRLGTSFDREQYRGYQLPGAMDALKSVASGIQYGDEIRKVRSRFGGDTQLIISIHNARRLHLLARQSTINYDVSAAALFGRIGGWEFRADAASGGGRGSTNKKVPQQTLKSHLATTRTIKTGAHQYQQRGGPLPPGLYLCRYLQAHTTFGECLRLEMSEGAREIRTPFASAPIAHGRDGFYIHGRGEMGSDGCIVPMDPAFRRKLNHAVRDFDGQVWLHVTAASYLLPAEHFTGTRA